MKSIIIRTSEDNYIPDSVDLRAQVSPRLITAFVKDMEALEKDPKVVATSLPKKLHTLEDKSV